MERVNPPVRRIGMRNLGRPALILTMLVAGLAGCTSATPTGTAGSGSAAPVTTLTGSGGATPAGQPPTESAPETPGGTESPTSAPARDGDVLPVVVIRNGGFVGAADRVTIAADGTVTVTRRGRTPTRATLGTAQLDELRRLLATPALAAEVAASARPGACNDGYVYLVQTPARSYGTDDCRKGDQPTVARIVAIGVGLLNS